MSPSLPKHSPTQRVFWPPARSARRLATVAWCTGENRLEIQDADHGELWTLLPHICDDNQVFSPWCGGGRLVQFAMEGAVGQMIILILGIVVIAPMTLYTINFMEMRDVHFAFPILIPPVC
jgi:hypothetical protein